MRIAANWHGIPRLVGAVLLLALPCGCSSMNNAERGALAGGGIGAGTGAVVGHAMGNTGAGAVLGGAIGAISGAIIGDGIDESERKADARAAAVAAARGPLGLTDVAQMAQQHISDEVIIGQIRSTGSNFRLSPSDIYWLKQNGVSDPIIQEMQASANRRPRRVYTATPVYPAVYEPVYVVQPPPPPVRVGVGFGYTNYGKGR